jgi:hypothetical protein
MAPQQVVRVSGQPTLLLHHQLPVLQLLLLLLLLLVVVVMVRMEMMAFLTVLGVPAAY